MAFEDKSSDGKFANVIRGVFIADIKLLRDVLNRKFRFAGKQVQYLNPPMVGEPLYDSLKTSVFVVAAFI